MPDKDATQAADAAAAVEQTANGAAAETEEVKPQETEKKEETAKPPETEKKEEAAKTPETEKKEEAAKTPETEQKEEAAKPEGNEKEGAGQADKTEKQEVQAPAEPPAPPPKLMRGVVLTGFGGLKMVKTQQKPEPSPGDAEVLIRVKNCGMSFQDLLLRQGALENSVKTPFIMGTECAGVVEALGANVEGFNVGDRVLALTENKGWAELTVAPVTQVYKIPDGLSFEDGAALLLNYLTAYILLIHQANIRPGQSILLHSAGGGVGQAMIQLCQMVGDVTVFATASPHKHDRLKEQVSHLFSCNQDYVSAIKKVYPEGIDVVMDCLSGEHSKRGINILKPLGKYIMYGSASAVTGESKSFIGSAKSWWHVDKISLIKLFEYNHLVGGFHLRHLLFNQKQHQYVRSVVETLLDLHGQGKIKPVIDTVFAFEDAAEGMQMLHDRKNFGKILLDPSKEPKQPPEPAAPQPAEPEPAAEASATENAESSKPAEAGSAEQAQEASENPEQAKSEESQQKEKSETAEKPDPDKSGE